MDQPLASTLQRQIDELVAQVARNKDDIDSLTANARASDQRADAAAQRADAAQSRVDRMEARVEIDQVLIAQLQAEGVVDREHISQLEAAVAASRTIGVALGILMATRHVGHDEALVILEGVSERTKMKVGQLAETIVAGAGALS